MLGPKILFGTWRRQWERRKKQYLFSNFWPNNCGASHQRIKGFSIWCLAEPPKGGAIPDTPPPTSVWRESAAPPPLPFLSMQTWVRLMFTAIVSLNKYNLYNHFTSTVFILFDLIEREKKAGEVRWLDVYWRGLILEKLNPPPLYGSPPPLSDFFWPLGNHHHFKRNSCMPPVWHPPLLQRNYGG